MSAVHHFDAATAGVHDAHDWWPTWYRRAFPDYVTHEVVTDTKSQKLGIDHRVTMEGGAVALVDIKCRCTSKTYHDDFLVEVWSDVAGRRLGWSRKKSHCQYIAYVWPQYEFGVLIPFQLLRTTYERHKHAWKRDGLRVVDAQNRSYVTRNVAVPLERFKSDVAEAMTVYFSAEAEPFT